MRIAIAPPQSEGSRSNILRYEANGQACCTYHGVDGCRDLGAVDIYPLVFVVYRHERIFLVVP